MQKKKFRHLRQQAVHPESSSPESKENMFARIFTTKMSPLRRDENATLPRWNRISLQKESQQGASTEP